MRENLSQYMQTGLKELAKKSALGLASAVTGFPVTGAIKFVLGLPDRIFWGKMSLFLNGILKDSDIQIKLSEYFNKDNAGYEKYTKRLIHIINSIDDDKKIDYFADLTR